MQKTTAIFSAIVFVLLIGAMIPARAQNEPKGGDSLVGIMTVPAVNEGRLCFVGWGDVLYVFDENKNEEILNVTMEPPLDVVDRDHLPAPAPTISGSYFLVHLGRRFWAVSRVDGRPVWYIDGLPWASRDAVRRTSDPLPGYAVVGDENMAAVLALEEDSGRWSCRRHSLGDGAVEWEYGLPGQPRGWWSDNAGLWIACEESAPEGASPVTVMPGVIVRLDERSGAPLWMSNIVVGATFKSVLRSDRRVFLVERLSDGQFQVRAFDEATGEIYRTITYARGELIAALESNGKIVFLHEGDPGLEGKVSFSLYHTSLNPIKFQTLDAARSDQPFAEPAIDSTLFFYAGVAYSLYDGSAIWRWKEDMQHPLVDWVSDSDHLFLWESTGSLVCLDRLTGAEIWRTPFNRPAPMELPLSKYGGAGMILDGNRLIAATPGGELYRVASSNGEPNPGVVRVANSLGLTGGGSSAQGSQTGAPRGRARVSWLWVILIIAIVLGAMGAWFVSRQSGESEGPG